MKWMTHQVGAVSAALALHLPPLGVAAACAGAVLPDVLDQKMAALAPTRRGRQKIFNAVHRGTTHWFGWWLLLLLGPFVWPLAGTERTILLGVAFGGLSHVLLDMLTPSGVPVFPFSRKRKVSLKLCSTGSVGEYIFLACMVAAVALFMGRDVLHLVDALGRGRLF